MMRLHSDWSYLEQAFDCSIRDHFLMAVRSLDNPRAVTPFLLESTGRQFGLFLHVEKGNVEAARLPPEIEPRYYQPYFTFDETEGASEASKSLSEAVEALAEGQRDLTVDRRLPLSIVKGLSDAFSVVVEGGGRDRSSIGSTHPLCPNHDAPGECACSDHSVCLAIT